MAALSSIILGVGTLTTVGGQVVAGNARANQANAQARENELQAKEILERSAINIEELGRERDRFLGRQTSGFAASGILVTDSQLLIQQETISEFDRKAENIKREAEFDAAAARRGAESLRATGAAEQAAGILGGAGSILSSAGSIASQSELRKSRKDT